MSNEIKNQIVKSWELEFPQLHAYSNNKLYCVVGACIFGIEFVTVRMTKYRPHFVCYPLWKESLKNCFEEPFLFVEVLDERGSQLDIPYVDGADIMNKAVKCIKNQLFQFVGNGVNAQAFLEFLDAQFSHPMIKISPPMQINLLQTNFFHALYLNEQNLINKVIDEIRFSSKLWPSRNFEWKIGTVDQWISMLTSEMQNKDQYMSIIATHKQDRKLKNLDKFELIK